MRNYDAQRNRLADLEAQEQTYCALGVGCDEYGVCYAEIHRQPEQCGRRAMPEPPTEQLLGYEYWDESESGTYRLTTGQFLLASVVVIIGAIALVL